MHTKSVPIQAYARTAGAFYLFIILAGIFGQILVRGSIVVPGDDAATVAHLVASESLWRWGIFGDVLMQLCDIPVMVLLYRLLRPVSRTLALTALGFNVIQTAVLVVNKLTLIVPLLLLGNSSSAAFPADQINGQVGLWIELSNYGFALGLIFFGLSCLLYGFLLFRSAYFPRTIGILVAIAGASYLVSSFTLILAPALSGAVTPVLVLSLVGELSFTLWLLIKGVNVAEWEKSVSANLNSGDAQ